MEEQKGQEKAHGSWDCGDFQGEAGSGNEGKQPLCNAMLITGPSGVGKTASVYACAQELGFKVFEVNSSSQRSGRHVLSQLREATQSHLVETSGKYPLKPAYFSNYAASSCRLKAEALPGKTGCLKNGTTTSKKRPALNTSSSGRKIKAKPATVTLAHYFKRREVADHPHFGVMKPGGRGLDGSLTNCDQTATRSKRMATSLILFEEVDVIFEDDVGFLAAIKAFMTTTRRPVILTTNDPFFKERFDCSMEEIIFKTPSAANVCSYLQLVCLAEKAQLEFEDVSSLFTLSRGDVRRCLLQLQLWVCSGRGLASQIEWSPTESACPQYLEAPEGESSDTQPPSHPTTCSALMLGFSNGTLSHLLEFLKYGSWSETETGLRRSLNLLAVSWRRDVPLLYSNLELLLTSSFMDKGTPSQHLNRIPHSRPQSEPQSTITDSPVQRLSRKVCVKYRKPVGSGHQLSRKKSIPTSSSDLSSREETYRSDDGVTDCLDALKDFYDVMSYIDASLSGSRTLVSGSCVPETFVWTGAAIKDGLVDEVNEEDPTSTIQDNILDMKATVEGLGCRLSWQRMYELWTVSHRGTLELKHTSYASCKRQRLSFTFQPLCSTREAKRRFRLSRMLQSSEPYSLRGDRRAVSVDYLPFLRSIWRFFNARKQKGELARCLMDLNDTHFSLSKSAMELLEEDFP
ncbi:ATPase family AAA domain-containing protein 5b [Menidia menidia]